MSVRNLFVIYNVIFLLVGNVLFSNIHYLNEHNHETHEDNECYECINFSNSHNYITDCNQGQSFKVETFQFRFDNSIITLIDTKIYLSRAPPIS
ncbi:uncharacterized protein METZ01_LOCUS94894 [marine metagenome]|uniref:Uncharacterized protein n=1 Tax=marine metagenome TaxID=408172 RepID=A0A381VNZ7_9ZZZZ